MLADLTDKAMLQLEEALAKQVSAIQLKTQETVTWMERNRHLSESSDDLQLKIDKIAAAHAQTVQVRLCLRCMLIAPCLVQAGLHILCCDCVSLGGPFSMLVNSRASWSHQPPTFVYMHLFGAETQLKSEVGRKVSFRCAWLPHLLLQTLHRDL